MYLVLTQDDLSKLGASTRADLLKALLSEPVDASRFPPDTEDFEWENRVDLTDEQVKEFIEGCSGKTVAGLRLIAEKGPKFPADLLETVGIDNYGHFQGRTTTRVRTVTGDEDAFLLTWDDWGSEYNQQFGCGSYAVTLPTHAALKRYFESE